MASEKWAIPVDVMLKGVATFKRCYEENERELSPMIVNVACRALTMVEQFIKESPIVAAMEVVRCKECKHCDPENFSMRSPYGYHFSFP